MNPAQAKILLDMVPEHALSTCSDDKPLNSRPPNDKPFGVPRCTRCALLKGSLFPEFALCLTLEPEYVQLSWIPPMGAQTSTQQAGEVPTKAPYPPPLVPLVPIVANSPASVPPATPVQSKPVLQPIAVPTVSVPQLTPMPRQQPAQVRSVGVITPIVGQGK